jgi:protein SCO1/2
MTAQKLISIVSGLLLAGCFSKQPEKVLPFYNTPDFTPQWLASADKEYSSVHTIAPFKLNNQQGTIITNKNVEGKIYVANFFFTKCTGICPKMNNNLKKIADAFVTNPDVLILSHTVMPEADSIARLAKYGEREGIDVKKWWLLTGDKNEIYTLARQSYFADEELGYNRNSNDFLHTENAVLVDRKGRIRGVYNATLALEMDKLVQHINLLLKEE